MPIGVDPLMAPVLATAGVTAPLSPSSIRTPTRAGSAGWLSAFSKRTEMSTSSVVPLLAKESDPYSTRKRRFSSSTSFR